MQSLLDQLTEVEAQIAAENAKGADKDQGVLATLEQKQAVILMQLDDEKAKQEQEAAQQVRIQAQEEKVATITLPYDFNEVFDDPRANEMISELIKEYKRADYAEHNAELTEIVAEYREKLRASEDRELQLKRQNDELELKLEGERSELARSYNENEDLKEQVSELELSVKDALAKRDAAVREKEAIELLLAEKQEHIDKLRDEIAIGAKAAINVTNISGNDRLAALVEQSKSAKIKSSLELALERTDPIRGKVTVVAPPALEEATFPAQASDSANIGLDNGQASGIPADHQEVTFPELPRAEVPSVSAPVVDTASANVGQGGQTLEERVSALEAHVFGYVKQAVA